jgi:peptide/nickel transport system ATP-binding protein
VSHTTPRLRGTNIHVAFATDRGARLVVGDVDITLNAGQTLGLAGESGSGKSTLALTLTGYPLPGMKLRTGRVELSEIDLLAAGGRQLAGLWGRRIAYLPQDAAGALDPRLNIGDQISEPLRIHLGLRRSAARARAAELLDEVGLPNPHGALSRYAHEFSGGQQQRIALAIAISCGPDVLLLDEPTTGLDTTTQALVNELIRRLVRTHDLSALYISHNLGVLHALCDEIAIMYAGEIVEFGPTECVLREPRHPYTARLVAAIPSVDTRTVPVGLPGAPPEAVVADRCGFGDRCALHDSACDRPVPSIAVGGGRWSRCVRPDRVVLPVPAPFVALRMPDTTPAVLELVDISFKRRHGRQTTFALGPITLSVRAGETLGIAGESGSGKSTLLKIAAGLLAADSGRLALDGQALHPSARRRPIEVRRRLQIIFQNPDGSLNPMHSVHELITRPMKVLRPELSSAQRRETVSQLLDAVRLPEDVLSRRPTELSGGQRQRVAIARALGADPEVLLCDEITSALDVSVQASIIELLTDLRSGRGLAMIFVTHDLGVLRALADEVLVMRNGHTVEHGHAHRIFERPQDPYTRELIRAVPRVPTGSSRHEQVVAV